MDARDRLERAWGRRPVDRPPFVPAVYEHKAFLIGRTPSDVARDSGLLLEALTAELETYTPDALTVGLDVYNVEAEAMGLPVRWFDDSADVPAIVSPGPGADPAPSAPPDPERDGRMPLLLETAARAVHLWGDRVTVRGAVSGPFSLACALAGTERLLAATIEDPPFVRDMLALAAETTAAFGAAFLRRGAGVILFDSKASPAASSPRTFREFVLPAYRDTVVPRLKAAGARNLPLIIGGNTDAIVDDLIATGATQILCDAGSDARLFAARCAERGRSFRISVDTRMVHHATLAEIRKEARRRLECVAGEAGVLFGCGVVAYDTAPERVLALREALEEFAVLPV